MDQNVFERYPLLIARMDQLSRAEDLQGLLVRLVYDLIVVDEAHRMSAHNYGVVLTTTRRYQLGRLLGRVARHLLLAGRQGGRFAGAARRPSVGEAAAG